MTEPVWVSPSLVPARAIPKSVTFTVPDLVAIRKDPAGQRHVAKTLSAVRWISGLRTARRRGRRAGQQRLEYLLGDRRGDAPTGDLGIVRSTVFDEHCDRVARLVRGRERDEPRVRILAGRGLRRACFARDCHI